MCTCRPDAPADELEIVALHRPTARGHLTAGVDPCIAPLIQALNDAGFQTVASCCGHNQRPGSIALEDGRELVVAASFEEARRIDALWPRDIHGHAMPPTEEDATP